MRGIFYRFHLPNLLLLGFSLRLIASLLYYLLLHPSELKPISNGNYQHLGTDGYFQIARTLWLSGEFAYEVGGQPVHSRPPLHPFLLMLTAAWSEQYWFLQWFVVSSLLGTAALAILYKLARGLGASPSQALKLTAILTFHPYLIIIARSTTFVHLATVLLLGAFYLFWLHKEKPLKYILLGIISGLCLLTHGSFQILPLTFALLILLKEKISPKSLFKVFLTLLFTVLTVLPWSLRNYLTFHQPIFLVTGMGMQYWKGEESAFPQKVDIYRKVYEEHTGKPLEIAYFCTLYPEDDALLWELGLKHIQQNPYESLLRWAYGVIIFLFPHETGWIKFLFTFTVNFPLYFFILRRRAAAPWLSWQNDILIYMLWVVAVFAFFTPHAGYIVIFLPLLTLLLLKN